MDDVETIEKIKECIENPDQEDATISSLTNDKENKSENELEQQASPNAPATIDLPELNQIKDPSETLVDNSSVLLGTTSDNTQILNEERKKDLEKEEKLDGNKKEDSEFKKDDQISLQITLPNEKMDVDNPETEVESVVKDKASAEIENTLMDVDNDEEISTTESDTARNKTDDVNLRPNATNTITDSEIKGDAESTKEDNTMIFEETESDLTQTAGSLQKESESTIDKPSVNINVEEKAKEDSKDSKVNEDSKESTSKKAEDNDDVLACSSTNQEESQVKTSENITDNNAMDVSESCSKETSGKEILSSPNDNLLQDPSVSSQDGPEILREALRDASKLSKTSQDASESSRNIPESSEDEPKSSTALGNCKDRSNFVESSQDSVNENPVFVHVSTQNEKGDKTRCDNDSQENQDEEDFRNNQPQEDPIASDDFAPVIEEETDEQGADEEQGASEELCIIPDTERVMSQEEKDSVATMVSLGDSSDANNTSEGLPKDSISDDPNPGKYVVSSSTDENVNTCMRCCLPRKSKFSVTYNKKLTFVCDDNCLTALRDKYGDLVVFTSEGDLRVKNLSSNSDNMIAKVKFHRKCMECERKILNDEFNLSWETMEFCNELCLSKYQKRIGANCSNCQAEVRSNCLGKYCVRFGYDIRQFCSSVCLEEYKKGLKVCSYCQKDMSGAGDGDGFLAPVGDKGSFKDFCTPQCMEKYDMMSSNREQPFFKPGSLCSVCLNEKPITIAFEHANKMNLFCGEPCFVAFKFVNNITPGKCDMCRKYFDNKILEENSMHYDNAQHSFCSKSCQNIYIIAHRKIVPCSWCKVKKYNFDMIKRNFCPGPMLMMCSLNCLNLYQVSVNAVSTKKTICDQCSKTLQPLYHLTMSDATIRNFCSYACVMAFQSQFPKTPITLNNEPEEPVPTGGPKRTKRFMSKNTTEPSVIPADVPTIPVISNVHSLATNGPSTAPSRLPRGAKNGTDSSIGYNSNTSSPIQTQIKQHVIIKPPPFPSQRNIATMCKIVMFNKGTSHKPTMVNKEVQTDEVKEKTALIPVPIPIFVPSPLWMYSMPFPVPFPFPLPVPVPIFIPTTRNSANGIMKEIKKIQVKIPTDPFEAELLMMAEMVAGDKKEDHTDSDSDEEENTGGAADETTYSPEPVDASNTFGDDMLQMALKMATELDEPAVDLEGALTASTITASQGGETAGTEESVDDPQPIHHMMERQPTRGRKRPGRPPKSGTASKRGRRASNQMDIPLMAPPQPPPPPEPVEKPDANMCLKFTFGVNAWKQWVTTKNTELEKSSHRVKLFKPEILQLTADELNYSLCLFVKEVRKPNGQEYAPDTIYYLCLGIQQYLFENGRIDNIFCDAYYEKFTDCLDDVAKKFSVLYNDSHYIVTRVEEEHLWESKQLGAHSPHVLLSTLMFFNTKHFNLTTVDEHMQLSFSHIMKHWKRNPNTPGTNKVGGSRNVLLRFYPPQTAAVPNSTTRKKKVYEQQENEENPLRCPVKLYEFYLSKCPESVKTRNDVFYLLPERSCVPDSPVWYSTMPLPRNALEKMLHRVKMVKEINVALLTS